MPWANERTYQYNLTSILAEAPSVSGVYGIYNSQRWIYIGESGDLKQRLIQHVNGDNVCILSYAPTGFKYELCPAAQRVQRQDVLILEYSPACNQKLG